MRILWVSNYTSFSGYSNQARLFVPRLLQRGHYVEVLNLSGGSNMPQQVGGVRVRPTHHDPLGNDVLLTHARDMQAHVVISLVDAFGLRPDIMGQVFWIPMTPIDHYPLTPSNERSLKAANVIFNMSQFGQKTLATSNLDSLFVPLAVSPAVWQPGDKQRARRALGWDDDRFYASFVGVNDSNPSRKGIFELLAAWQLFYEQRPNSTLYMHTSVLGNIPVSGGRGGVDIPRILETLGLPQDAVSIVDQDQYATGGISQRHLNTIAQASDVLVQPSRGEGFGLPLLEFQRAGCPVITTDYAAGAELCFGGWRIEYEPEWSSYNSMRAKPGIAAIIEALLHAESDRDNPRRKRAAIEGAMRYDVDTVVDNYFIPALTVAGEMLLEASATYGKQSIKQRTG